MIMKMKAMNSFVKQRMQEKISNKKNSSTESKNSQLKNQSLRLPKKNHINPLSLKSLKKQNKSHKFNNQRLVNNNQVLSP